MEADPVDLSEEYRDLLRRDWAVRVLDAWAKGGGSGDTRDWQCQPDIDGGVCFCSVSSYKTNKSKNFQAETEDAARLAAAKAVYPTLPDTVRAQLGEAP